MRFLHRSVLTLVLSCILVSPLVSSAIATADQPPTPEKFLGFRVGEDKKLARWDKIVEYLSIVAAASDRVRLRELGKSTNGNAFIALEISAPETIKNLDRFKQLERKLYFQGGAPTETERDQILKSGKSVVLVTCNIHATEIGSSQMVLELVHRLATEASQFINTILDNVFRGRASIGSGSSSRPALSYGRP